MGACGILSVSVAAGALPGREAVRGSAAYVPSGIGARHREFVVIVINGRGSRVSKVYQRVGIGEHVVFVNRAAIAVERLEQEAARGTHQGIVGDHCARGSSSSGVYEQPHHPTVISIGAIAYHDVVEHMQILSGAFYVQKGIETVPKYSRVSAISVVVDGGVDDLRGAGSACCPDVEAVVVTL